MPSKEFNLGNVELIYPSSSLKLTTGCSIELSSPHALEFPFSSVFQSLQSLVSSGSWIDRGHVLKISFRICVKGLNFLDRAQAAFREGLEAVFCNAEVVFESRYVG